MSPTRTLTLLWTPGSAAVAAMAIVATLVLCIVAYRRSGYSRLAGLLELLRFTLVGLGVLLLNQPEIVEEFRSNDKASVVILADASPSMGTRDVAASNAKVMPRHQAIAHLLDESCWNELRERFDVVVQPFRTGDPVAGTNLNKPLADAPGTHKNLVGVVLISDGDWNAGQAPVEAATQLRLKGVPVFCVPVGSRTRLPDVELVGIDAPTFGILGKSVRIGMTIDSSLPRDYSATVSLRTSHGETVTKDIRIAAMGRTNDWIAWKPQEAGDVTLTVEIPVHSEEMQSDNNRLSVPIAIRQEKLRVLLIESYPRWEYRYLRNAMSRDPGVELSCLLFQPELGKVGGGNKDYIKHFPNGLDELAKFDVVFLGDVGLGDGQLTAEQCGWLKGMVEHQASGIVFMPGREGRQFSLLDTPLSELYPVALDDAQRSGWGSRTPCRFELTELGRHSLLTKLADTEQENSDVWDDLPGFQWYAPVVRARANCEVLAVHRDAQNHHGRLPLLVTRPFGAGKVLFMGTDGAWRWRKGVEDTYHYRFWGQVVRWMAYQRNMAKGKTMRLYYSPDQPRIGGTVSLSVNVMDRTGEPLQRGDVSGRITAPSGKAETVVFASSNEQWGAFASRFTIREPGKHKVVLSCKQTVATLEASFFAQGDFGEKPGKPARPDVLEEIARVTHGKVIEANRRNEIIASLARLPDPPPAIRRIQLWSDPIVAGVMVALLGAFWIGRKAIGLI